MDVRGGTSETIRYYGGEGNIFNATVYHCGGDDYGTLCGESKAFASDLKNIIPDFSGIMKSTEE